MRLRLHLSTAVALLSAVDVCAQTVGLLRNEPGAAGGYTLFTPLQRPETYLIDERGRVVHTWPGASHAIVYLLDDGDLLRTVAAPVGPPFDRGLGVSGRVERLSWDGDLEWRFDFHGPTHAHHHDIEPMPNGNVLLMAWEFKDRDEALAAGRDPALLPDDMLWPEMIVEVRPTGPTSGEIVWEWRLWDHLVQQKDPTKANFDLVADHPERVDLNWGISAIADWIHWNAIDYHAELDQIVVSSRSFSEIWVIDHGTTTAEAASHTGGRRGRGGDLLYRWGNPQTYDHGTADHQVLFYQHDVQWIEAGRLGAGDLIVFNNGPRPASPHSSVDVIAPPIDADGDYLRQPARPYWPPTPYWSYVASPTGDFYSRVISGAERLANGNTLVCEGLSGNFFEVTPTGDVVWRYVSPVIHTGAVVQGTPVDGDMNPVHRARRYAADHPGLVGRDLTPRGPIELYPLLRNADLDRLRPRSPALDTIFTGTGATTLDRVRDLHVAGFAAGAVDDDPSVCAGRPLLFYQVDRGTDALKMVADGPCRLRIHYQ